jgi:NAD+ kinase
MLFILDMNKRVAIVCKAHHPKSSEVLSSCLKLLTKYSSSLIIDEETYNSFKKQCDSLKDFKILPRNLLPSSSDLIIVLGGDGTLISVCRHSRNTDLNGSKILGFNLGHLGFLTETGPENIERALNLYFEDKTSVIKTPLLEIEVKQNEISKYFALNDVVINKQALARIFVLTLSVDGESASQLKGDGLIVSSPSGSTAYSLAAGGSIVHPKVNALLLTPICPHSLTSRPIVIPGTAEVTIELDSENRNNDVFLTIDGQEGLALEKNALVSIKNSSHYVEFVKLPYTNYFSNLSNKLGWG